MLGISTLAFRDVPIDEALDEIERLCGHVEIFSEGKHDLFPDPDILSCFDLSCSVHAPIRDINIASPREQTRKASLDILTDMAEICMSIGAEVMVIHPGYVYDADLREEGLRKLSQSLRTLSGVASETGVRICLENMPADRFLLFQKPGEAELPENIGFALDIGHAHTNGVLEEFLNERTPDHFHIHDNDGTGDQHLAFGDGSIGLPGLEKIRRTSGALMIIENKSAENALKSLKVLKENGF